ncbi:hypothetical protein QAD02_005040 [Eretmocerus hayati]|uniref:Uncharacterized protein n=1 Tax=Eretmocerus hayati TaxID=131215 RepID=A0ACC2NRE4_9HYME|nr:hypothetical protein QAD02_005040 [Eretmocerus hayati]
MLLYLGRKTLNSIETLGCTDIRQQWGQIKQKVDEAYSVEPFDSFCHGAQCETNYMKNPNMSQYIYRTLCRANPESELSLHAQCTKSSSDELEVNNNEFNCKVPNRVLKSLLSIPNTKSHTRVLCNLNPVYRYPNSSASGDNGILRFLKKNLWESYLEHFPMNIKTAAQAIFYNRSVVIKKERAKEILFKIITQNNPLWHAARRLRITGSICYYMFTYMINNHDLDEWIKKLETLYMSSFKENAHIFRGNQLESTAIQAYHEKTGYTIEKAGIVILHNTPWLGFSPDAIADGDTLVEVKCPKNDNKVRADELVKCQ